MNEKVVLPTDIFVELTSLAELNFLTNASTRIKFTCLAASPLYLAVGSSGGSVYLFSRYASKHRKSLSNVPLQVIPCKEGSVTNIKISPNENKIAVASSRGFMFIVSISGNRPSTTVTNVLHTGSEVTALSWTKDSSRVYAGDTLGRFSCTRTGKTYFKSPCDIVLQLESKIVQIDCCQIYVVISTLSRCYVHDYSSLKTVQVGKKLRSGSYGAIFYPTTDDVDQPIIFAARPGGRLWEVNCNGSVYNTHQFTTVKAPVASVVDWNRSFSFPADLQLCSLSFSELYIICDQFLLSINGSKGTVLDPRSASVVLFTSFDEDVVRYAVCGNDVFILTKDASLRKLTLFPFVKAVEKLQFRQCYLQSAQLITNYLHENESCPWKIEFLKDILDHLEDKNDEFVRSFAQLVEKSQNFNNDLIVKKQCQVTKMSSGIHKVVKIMENSGYDDDFAFRAPTSNGLDENNSTSSPSSNSLKRRSRSTPMVNNFKNGYRSFGKEKYSQTTTKKQSSPPVVSYRDDTDVCAPGVVEQSQTMTSSRSEESLCSLLLDVPTLVSPISNDVDSSPKERQAPKIITSSLRNDGNLFLNAFVQQLNVLSLGGGANCANIIGSNNGDASSYSTTLHLDEGDDDDATTPVAETPDDYLFKRDNIGSPLFKDLSSIPNVVRRNPRSNRLNCKSTTNDVVVNGKIDEQSYLLTSGASNGIQSKKLTDTPIANEPTAMASTEQLVNVQYFDTSYVSVVRTDTPTLENISSLNCDRCFMHKSWLIFFRFSYVVRRLPIVFQDELMNGAVPSTIEDWTMLVDLWRSLKRSPNVKLTESVKNCLCTYCRTMLNSWFDDNYSLGSKNYFTFLNEILNHTSSQSKTVDRSKSDFYLGIDRETLTRTFFRTETNRLTSFANEASATDGKEILPSTTATEDRLLSCSMYYNPLYESFCETTGDDENGVCKNFSWLPEVSLDVLACCARQSLDDDEFEKFVNKNEWMNEFLTPNFYRFIHSYDARSILPNEIVISLIRDFLDDNCIAISTDDDVVRVSKTLPFSFNLSNACPCCTLSILSKVTEFESTVVLFRCGHSFHKVCLPKSPGASKKGLSYFCLICNPTNDR